MDTKELRLDRKWSDIVTDRITVLREDYAIQAAGSYLYEFIGTNLYFTFDKLVLDQDRDSFLEIMREGRTGAAYLLRLVNTNGRPEWFVFEIESCTLEKISFKVTNLSSALEVSLQMKEKTRFLRTLLDICDHLYFSYASEQDFFRIVKIKKEGNFDVYEGSLASWIEEGLKQGYLLGEQEKTLRHFQGALEEEESYFEHLFSTSFFSRGKEMQAFSFKGNLSVQGGGRVMAGVIMPVEGNHINMGDLGLSFVRDVLTGLFNKKDIELLARRSMRHNPDNAMALAIIDLDNFKTINDTKGHLFGDEILVRATAVMKSAVGDKGYVGRIGGDEFMLVITSVKDEDDLRNILRSIRTEMTQICRKEETSFRSSCSIGCACYPVDAKEYKQLFKLADYALYLAKEKGKNRYIIYQPAKHGYPKFNEEDNLISINPLRNMPVIDFIGEIYEEICGHTGELHALMEKIRAYFNLERMVLYDREKRCVELVSAESVSCYDDCVTEAGYLEYAAYQTMFDEKGVLFCNNIKLVENKSQEAYAYLDSQHCLSMIQIKLKGPEGESAGLLSFESCDKRRTWSAADRGNFFLMARFLTGKILKE